MLIRTRHRWTGFSEAGQVCFATPGGEKRLTAGAVVLALGGGSWPTLGSDGSWAGILSAMGCRIAPLRPANCGFDVAWSAHMQPHFGKPLKAIALSFGGRRLRGEIMLTDYGIEGSAVYALSADLREAIEKDGSAILRIDLKPDLDAATLQERLARPQGRLSLSNWLRKSLNLPAAAVGLLRETGGRRRSPPAKSFGRTAESRPPSCFARRALWPKRFPRPAVCGSKNWTRIS